MKRYEYKEISGDNADKLNEIVTVVMNDDEGEIPDDNDDEQMVLTPRDDAEEQKIMMKRRCQITIAMVMMTRILAY